MLAISSALLSGAWGSGALAQGFPSEFDLDTLNGSNGFIVVGEEGNRGSFGRTVASAGDVNGDGIDDVIIGHGNADNNDLNNSGSSYVVFGKATGETPPAEINVLDLDGSNGFRLDGHLAGESSGHSVAGAGDINGDGLDDLIIGAPDYSGSLGRAYMVFGKDTTIGGNEFPGTLSLQQWTQDGTKGFRVIGEQTVTDFGWSVSAAGDFDGDGIDDVIIGAPGGTGAWVVLGKEATESDPFLFQVAPFPFPGTFLIDNFEGFTNSVASAGDVNGDGLDDVIIGDSPADNNGVNSGSSYVVFGRGSASGTGVSVQTDLNGSNGFRLDGEVGHRSGDSVASAGDINGDGIDDLLIWSPNPNSGSGSGRSYVVFGRDTTLVDNEFPGTLSLEQWTQDGNGSNGFRLDGLDSEEAFLFRPATAVSAAGDVNGDGIDDLIVTDYRRCTIIGATNTCTSSSYVLFGKAEGEVFDAAINVSSLDGSDGFRLFGETSSAFPARHHVAAAGDVNSDGIDDLIIGSPRSEPPRSYVVFGGISGPGLIPRVALDSTTLEFGDIELGQTAVRTLTVENNGTGTLSPGALSITGAQAGDFSIELNSCLDAQLATGESCTIDIGFAPTAPGIRQAALDLQSNAPSSPALVPLRGNNDGLFADDFEQKPGI
jgi:hypothetical protein